MAESQPEELGLELLLQHPTSSDATRIPTTRGEDDSVLYPELDTNGDMIIPNQA